MIYLLGFMSGLAGGQGSRISAVNVGRREKVSGDHSFATHLKRSGLEK